MNTYNNDEMEMQCDDCGEATMFYGSYAECIEDAKRDGWRLKKIEDEWFHTCPVCTYDKNDDDPREFFGGRP